MHQMLVPELDNVLYQLITDLEDRGMLQDTRDRDGRIREDSMAE